MVNDNLFYIFNHMLSMRCLSSLALEWCDLAKSYINVLHVVANIVSIAGSHCKTKHASKLRLMLMDLMLKCMSLMINQEIGCFLTRIATV